jgi:hypothetical protein
VLPPELDWRPQPDGVTISVADVTPEMRTEMLAWFERWLKPGTAK